jgi:hypothetical protein
MSTPKTRTLTPEGEIQLPYDFQITDVYYTENPTITTFYRPC